MHSHRPFSFPRRLVTSAALLAALGGAFAAHLFAQEPVAAPPAGAPALQPGQEGLIRIEVGEETQIRATSGKAIKTVLVSRPGIARFAPISETDPTVVTAKGVGVGSVDATLVDEQGAANKVTIRVLPDLGYVRDAIHRHYPRTNLSIEKVGELTVVISGDVEMGEQIPGLVQLVESMVGKGYVINNMRQAGVMQVQIEVCLAQVRRNEIRNMGFNFLGSGRDAVIQSTVGGLIPQPLTGPALTSQTIPPGFLTSSSLQGGLGSQGGATTNLVFGVFDEATSFFGFLQALRNENLAKILANPTLTTISGRAAFFNVGGQEPYGTAGSAGTSGGGGAGIQFKDFGTNVRFLPVVLGNGKIRIEVQPEVSFVTEQITQANIVAPRLEVTRMETTIELESGQTMVIGGLIQSRLAGTTTKTPILGDLPFLGAAFRTVSFNEVETELLIIVTPHLVDALDACQRPTRLPGQETRTVTDFELFLEGILEAPRGQRPLCPDGTYRPAHYWAPSHCFPYGTPKGAQSFGGGACGTCGAGCGPMGGKPTGHAYEMMRPEMAAPVAATPQQSPMDVTPLSPVVPAQYVPDVLPVAPAALPGETPNSDVQRPDAAGASIPAVPAETPVSDAQRPGATVPTEVAPAKVAQPAEAPMPVDEKK